MNDNKMTPGELRATWGLGTVFSLRMLGMFMVLPVLTTYGMALQGASEALIGGDRYLRPGAGGVSFLRTVI